MFFSICLGTLGFHPIYKKFYNINYYPYTHPKIGREEKFSKSVARKNGLLFMLILLKHTIYKITKSFIW